MRLTILLLFSFTALYTLAQPAPPGVPEGIAKTDWPWWRGPNRNGIAEGNPPPVKWNEGQNIRWKVPLPGRGHSSPTIAGKKVVVLTADEKTQVQSVLCFHRDSGRELWRTELHRRGFSGKLHKRNSWATSTVAWDGERFIAAFHTQDTIVVTALNPEGDELWQRKITDFESHWGFATSPMIYKDLVIVAAEHRGMGTLTALQRSSGKQAWQTERIKKPNHTSPAVFTLHGKDQLLICGAHQIAGYEPLSGKKSWSAKATTLETVGTVTVLGDLVFASGGWPDHETACVKADGSGEVVWKNKTKIYQPSLLAHAGHVYGITDAGIAFCWKATTGQEMWKERLASPFSASPVLINGILYAAGENGTTFVLNARPDKMDVIAENKLGQETFSTPSFSDGRLYHRSAYRLGQKRQEFLFCIAAPE